MQSELEAIQILILHDTYIVPVGVIMVVLVCVAVEVAIGVVVTVLVTCVPTVSEKSRS